MGNFAVDLPFALRFLKQAMQSTTVDWYGWEKQQSSRGYDCPKGHHVLFRGIKKVFGGDIPLLITLRLEAFVPFYPNGEDFDKEKHRFWFSINVEDILAISGFRTLVRVFIDENDGDAFKELLEIFFPLYKAASVSSRGKSPVLHQFKQDAIRELLGEPSTAE